MKGTLRIWLYEITKLNPRLNVLLVIWLFCFLASASFVIFSIVITPDENLYALFFGFLGIGIPFLVLYISLVLPPLFAIRKFSKLFGFWPPVTPDGRDALQAVVDLSLSYRAKDFFHHCSNEEGIRAKLQDLASEPTDASGRTLERVKRVEELESYLLTFLEGIQRRKKEFWVYHKAVSSDSLPYAFKVCPSIKDYKELGPDGRARCGSGQSGPQTGPH